VLPKPRFINARDFDLSCSLIPLQSSHVGARRRRKVALHHPPAASSPEVFFLPGARGSTELRTYDRFASPAYDTPSGFLNLLTFLLPAHPCLAFRQAGTLEIFPFEDLIPRTGWIHLTVNPPPSAVTLYPHDAAGTHRADLFGLGFRALTPARGPKQIRSGVSISNRCSILPWGSTS
jgi:hypothetical protein